MIAKGEKKQGRAVAAVLGLFARMSLGRVALVFALSALLRIGLTVWTTAANPTLRPEGVLASSGAFVCIAVTFLLVTAVLCLGGCEYGAKCGYTLRRLGIGERQIFWCQAVYGGLVYLALWLWETVLAYGLAYYAALRTGTMEAQTLLICFYQNGVLHGLLPLEDGWIWARDLLLLFSLSLTVAEFPYVQRRGRFAVTAPVMALFVLLMWSVVPGEGLRTGVCIVTSLIVAAEVLYQLYIKEDPLNA